MPRCRPKLNDPLLKIIKARTYKNFESAEFTKDIAEAPWSICTVFNDPDDCYWAWSHIFNDICQRHAPYHEIKIRRQSLPWITPQISHLMNLRYKTLKKAKQSNNLDQWSSYRTLRNKVTHEIRLAKSMYYIDLFNEVRDYKSYWNLIKKATNSHTQQPILGIRRTDGKIETSDQKIAQILNEHFLSQF